MRINPVNNNNYQPPQVQQSFGAIKGNGIIRRKVIRHWFRPNEERLIQGISFDEWLTSNIKKSYPRADDLEKLNKKQAKLTKTGKDFNTMLDKLTITSPQGEVIHPIIDYKANDSRSSEKITATIDNVNYGEFCIYDDSKYEIETVFGIIKDAVDDLASKLRNAPECFAEKLGQAKLRLGIKPPPSKHSLEQGVYKDFAELSGIPEEQAQALLSELIKRLKTPSGKTATTQELLETVEQAGLIQPQLTEAEELAIQKEVEAILPAVPGGEISEMMVLKNKLRARG